MSLIDKSIEEIKKDIAAHYTSKSSLRHYEVCKALAQGLTQEQIAEKFNFNDDRVVRHIKKTKCPECGKSRKIN